MSGEKSGMQRRIRDRQPKALNTHCAGHSLNLAQLRPLGHTYCQLHRSHKESNTLDKSMCKMKGSFEAKLQPWRGIPSGILP